MEDIFCQDMGYFSLIKGNLEVFYLSNKWGYPQYTAVVLIHRSIIRQYYHIFLSIFGDFAQYTSRWLYTPVQ